MSVIVEVSLRVVEEGCGRPVYYSLSLSTPVVNVCECIAHTEESVFSGGTYRFFFSATQ